jgi:hypothetical protein
MPTYHESVTKNGVSQAALEVILPPRDLGEYPMKTITLNNAAGGAALADAKIEVGPTASGPWLAEDLTGTGIPTLAPGASAAYRMTKVDRWLRVQAKATGAGCNLTVYLDAVG